MKTEPYAIPVRDLFRTDKQFIRARDRIIADHHLPNPYHFTISFVKFPHGLFALPERFFGVESHALGLLRNVPDPLSNHSPDTHFFHCSNSRGKIVYCSSVAKRSSSRLDALNK